MKIITYGSLLNLFSLEKSLKRKSFLKKIIVPGVERIFNAPFGDYSFLNLRQSFTSQIEAAYFEIEKKELKKFRKREEGSKMKEIIPGYFAFIWPENKCEELPVLQSYINFCVAGADELGVDLWKGTIKPLIIINDLECPLYP